MALTGLAEQDLAVWPGRYGLVVPALTPAGRPAYTAAQLAALRLLRTRQLAGDDEAAAHSALADRLSSAGDDVGQADPAAARAARVLIVGREPYVLAVLGEALVAAGAVPVSAAGGAAARAAVEREPVAAAVVEVLLSGESGLGLCTWLADRGVPVVLVSSLRTVDEAFGVGAHAHQTKPLDPGALLPAVLDVLTPVGPAERSPGVSVTETSVLR